MVAPALGSRSCSELRGESCTAGDIEHVSLPQRLLWGGPTDTSRPRRADTWVRPLRLLWGGPIDTSRPGGRTRGSAPTSTMGRTHRHHRDPAGGHVGPPLRLLWGGPIDTSRPGGRTRGSAPTSTMGRAYRHIATRRADTWVRPYVYYGAGLQTHRDPAGGHVGPPPTPIMLMIAEQLPARAALDPDRGHRYSGPQIHRTQGGGEIP